MKRALPRLTLGAAFLAASVVLASAPSAHADNNDSTTLSHRMFTRFNTRLAAPRS